LQDCPAKGPGGLEQLESDYDASGIPESVTASHVRTKESGVTQMDPVDLDWAHSDPGSHAKVNATASSSRKSGAGAVNADTQTGGGNVPGSAVAARQNVNEHTCRIIRMACELGSKHEGQKLRIGIEEGTRVRFEYGCALRMKSKISGYSNPGRNVACYRCIKPIHSFAASSLIRVTAENLSTVLGKRGTCEYQH